MTSQPPSTPSSSSVSPCLYWWMSVMSLLWRTAGEFIRNDPRLHLISTSSSSSGTHLHHQGQRNHRLKIWMCVLWSASPTKLQETQTTVSCNSNKTVSTVTAPCVIPAAVTICLHLTLSTSEESSSVYPSSHASVCHHVPVNITQYYKSAIQSISISVSVSQCMGACWVQLNSTKYSLLV